VVRTFPFLSLIFDLQNTTQKTIEIEQHEPHYNRG
jgi:hypothetical protein